MGQLFLVFFTFERGLHHNPDPGNRSRRRITNGLPGGFAYLSCGIDGACCRCRCRVLHCYAYVLGPFDGAFHGAAGDSGDIATDSGSSLYEFAGTTSDCHNGILTNLLSSMNGPEYHALGCCCQVSTDVNRL